MLITSDCAPVLSEVGAHEADATIGKPFDLGELLETVDQLTSAPVAAPY